MQAVRVGHVFSADQGPLWMHSHAAYPVPLLMGRDRLRVYFNTRDTDNRGWVGWVDVSPNDPTRLLDVSERPCLAPGPLGSFDDRGISNGSIQRVDDRLWLYYMGWSKGGDVPFRNAIGLAVADGDGLDFKRQFEGPILDRSRHDPYTLSYPFVSHGGDKQPWRMTYGSNLAAGRDAASMQHVLKEAISEDGIDWRPTGRVVAGPEDGEFGLSRPWLAAFAGTQHLFYSIRSAQYAIGCSQLEPSGTWRRKSADLLGPSADAWDIDASCYASVISVEDRHWMFYCGSRYGLTGFGVASLGFE